MTPEGKVKKEIKEYLDSIGAYYFMPVQMGYGQKGLDFHCCVPYQPVGLDLVFPLGLFVVIEVKEKGKWPTKFQQLTMDTMRKAGATVSTAWNAVAAEAIVTVARNPSLQIDNFGNITPR